MTATPSQIGPYTITREIGRGGMGVVYLARDTKLDRDVAIKALPEELARDADRLARFEREAKTLAQLNHTNIAGIHGIDEQDGKRYLILEYVEGETLADRLDRGALPADESIEIAIQIASGLEAAHEAGVIHRDLKPDNIRITPDGIVKVLDFGLARNDDGAAGSGSDLANSPTIPDSTGRSPTSPGAILGTAAYMSPEQARGRRVDRRSDIWSFGVMLCEMLTGIGPFHGETASDSIGAVLHKEIDLERLPPETPPAARRVLRRCVTRDPRQRMQHIGDARLELAETRNDTDAEPALASGSPAKLIAALALIILVLVIVIAMLLPGRLDRDEPSLPEPLQLSIVEPTTTSLPPEASLNGPSVAISRDGTTVAYLVPSGTSGQGSSIKVRDLSQPESRDMPGTEGAVVPFFSPDGSRLAFISRGKLRVGPVNGAPPREICDAPSSRGGCWIDDDTILISFLSRPVIHRITVSTGAVEAVTRVNEEKGEITHETPEPIAGTEKFLFTVRRVRTGGTVGMSLAMGDLTTGEHRILVEDAGQGRYADGVLVFSHADGTVRAVAFDPSRGETFGSQRIVLASVRTQPLAWTSDLALSATGRLVYIPGRAGWTENTPVWRTLDGDSEPALPERRAFTVVQLSPDDQFIAAGISDPFPDIWRYDLRTNPPTRLRLTDDGRSVIPIWSSDGTEIIHASMKTGILLPYRRAADGSGEPELLFDSPYRIIPNSWSSDGKMLAYTSVHPETSADIWIYPLDGETEPWQVVGTRFNESFASFSPDGDWIAYQSDESGTIEVYVRHSDGSGGAFPVSVGGGVVPLWRGDEIFYRQGDVLMVAKVTTDPELKIDTPMELFSGLATSGPPVRLYDVNKDRTRVLVSLPEFSESGSQYLEIRVVTDWIEQVKELLEH